MRTVADSAAQSRARYHPRPNAGSPRLVRFDDGEEIEIRSTIVVLLHRFRSKRKPGPMLADASVALPGEYVALPDAPERVGIVVR